MIQIDMDMPKSCKECPLTYTDTGDDVYFGKNIKRCVFDNAEISGEDSRYDDCQLREVKTGHWIELDECSNEGYYCSKCHKRIIKIGWSNTVKKIKYCPNCGRRMEGEE